MDVKLEAFLVVLWVSTVNCYPQVTNDDSLVISSSELPEKKTGESSERDGPILPKIYEMKVETNVSNRFAKSQITSKVKNLNGKAQEATFSVVLPDQAYISGFIMEVDGIKYEAYVQEKEQAENTYKTAVAGGQAAAHVAVNARDSNRFTVSVNIEPQKKATFYLKYEELLARQNEKYLIVINIHPGQPVKNLDVEVHIDESRPIKFVRAPPLRSGNEISKNDEKLNPNAEITTINKTSTVVKFSPDLEKQKQYAHELGTASDNGLAGQFVVEYDVERDPQGGEVLVDGGYFVHFFAPSDIRPIPKQVVFILDTSGSMDGIRITQLKEAMRSILSEMQNDDIFNIVEFGSIVKVWNIEKVAVQFESGIDTWELESEDPEAVFKNRTEQPLPGAYSATQENIKKAEQVVEKLRAFGGTDIQSAVEIGIQLIDKNHSEDKKHQPIIIFLTDGEATVGETQNDRIISTITELNKGKCPIFSLSFGDGADRNFLQKISLKNLGFARHIYEGADASLQLEQFYKEISSPLLSNVTFKYVSKVSKVTKTHFPILFHGAEIVVSGQIEPGFAASSVEGWGINGPVELTPVIQESVGSLERLWAYLTLKQILQQRDAADNKTGPTQEALRIALKYSFVSDVSSLVVVKPNATNAVDTEDASSDKRYPIIASGVPLSSFHNAAAFPGRPSPQFIAASSLGSPYNLNQPLYLEEALEEQDFGIDRLIVGGSYSSTPFLPSITTDKPDTTVNVDNGVIPSEIDELKKNLPWLSSVLNEHGTLTLTSGVFSIGLNETISVKPKCPKSPLDVPGNCTLIHKCPQIYKQLTDQKLYEKYFCNLNGFAGVCCPEED